MADEKKTITVLQDVVGKLLRARLAVEQQRQVVAREYARGEVYPSSEQYLRQLEEAAAFLEEAVRLAHGEEHVPVPERSPSDKLQ